MFFRSQVTALATTLRRAAGTFAVRKRRRLAPLNSIPLALETRLLPTAVPIGDVITVVADDDLTNALPWNLQSIATSADGDFVVTWAHWTELAPNDCEIWARQFHADGTPAGGAFLVNTTSVLVQNNPSVAMNDAGDFVIVWESKVDGGFEILARRYDASGVAQGNDFRVSSDVGGYSQTPKVSIDADGAFVVTWSKDFYNAYARRFDATGVPSGNQFLVTDDLGGYGFPDVAMTPGGGFIITWTDGTIIYGQRFTGSGSPASDPFHVGANQFADAPKIAVDADGNFVVSWYAGPFGDPTVKRAIYARLFMANGTPRGEQFQVSSSTTNDQSSNSVAMADNGNFVISWTDYDSHWEGDIRARGYNSTGIPLTDEFIVTPVTADDQRFGQVAVSSNEAVVTWMHEFGEGIYARRFSLNAAPADIALSADSVPENSPAGTLIGSLSSTDFDGGSFTYALVSGAGDSDNVSFQIVGNELRAATSFDYESQTTYSVRVSTTDLAGDTFERTFTIHVTNVLETPRITLDAASVNENQPIGTLVGLLGLTDAPGGPVQFRLVAGKGSSGNARLSVSGNQLLTRSSFNFELKSSYPIRVQMRTADGQVITQLFTIHVTDINEGPTGLSLSPPIISENNAVGAVIGTFSAIDPDAGDNFNYTLVAGGGSTDNARFTIDGNQLKAVEVFDYERKRSCSIRVRVTDAGGLWFEKTLVIRILNRVG